MVLPGLPTFPQSPYLLPSCSLGILNRAIASSMGIYTHLAVTTFGVIFTGGPSESLALTFFVPLMHCSVQVSFHL